MGGVAGKRRAGDILRTNPDISKLKVVVVGENAVGKTSLNRRFKQGFAPPASIPSTMGIDFGVVVVERSLNGGTQKVQVQLWDTAGQEQYRGAVVGPQLFKGAHCVIVAYDITSRAETYDNCVKYWSEMVQRYCNRDVVKYLVGNKIDIEQKELFEYTHAEHQGKPLMTRIEEERLSHNARRTTSRCLSALDWKKRIIVVDHHGVTIPLDNDTPCESFPATVHFIGREVTLEEGQNLAAELYFDRFFETSAYTGHAVEEMFNWSIDEALRIIMSKEGGQSTENSLSFPPFPPLPAADRSSLETTDSERENTEEVPVASRRCLRRAGACSQTFRGLRCCWA